MQSQKKHRMPKREKVNALDFAQGFLVSVSASADTREEAISKAVLSARNMQTAALSKSKDSDLRAAEAKEWTRTANFWDNIAGHLPKVKYK
jgi:hypothetical protein